MRRSDRRSSRSPSPAIGGAARVHTTPTGQVGGAGAAARIVVPAALLRFATRRTLPRRWWKTTARELGNSGTEYWVACWDLRVHRSPDTAFESVLRCRFEPLPILSCPCSRPSSPGQQTSTRLSPLAAGSLILIIRSPQSAIARGCGDCIGIHHHLQESLRVIPRAQRRPSAEPSLA